jgi:regulator of sigma E protease
MQTFIMIAQVIAALSILVLIHELGHFLAAKLFKIKVDKFYLFFDFLFPMPSVLNFALFKFKKGDTEYGLGWFPMGGYVQINGMVDENMGNQDLTKPAEPWEFRSKPAWQRMIVMLGGIIFNIILGIIIFSGIKYYYGEKLLLNSSVKKGIAPSELAQEMGFRMGDKIESVNGNKIIHLEDALNAQIIMSENPVYIINRNDSMVDIKLPNDFLKRLTKKTKGGFFTPRMELFVEKTNVGSAAEKAGLMPNDKIIGVDTNNINCFDEFQPLLIAYAGKETPITVIRNEDTLKLVANIGTDGKLGFMPTDKNWKFDTITYTFFASIPAGINQAYETIAGQIAGWGKIFNGDIPVNKAVQGPIGIAKYFGPTWDWLNFWMLTALISMGLAFMNFLPIPALDGGHVVLLIIEMVTKKPISIKIQERVQSIGTIILLSLMLLIFGNDIFSLFK